MGILERLVSNEKHEKKAGSIVEKLIKMIDQDPFFWDKPQKLADFFNKEIKQKIESEERTLFSILKQVLPKKHLKQIDLLEKEHDEILSKYGCLDGLLKNQAKYSPKNLKKEIIGLSGGIIEQIVQHANKEWDMLSPLIKKHFKEKNYKDLRIKNSLSGE
jgi:hemerythrin-like domain-containing protein